MENFKYAKKSAEKRQFTVNTDISAVPPVAVANIMGDVQTEGVVCGVDALGRLLVETHQGELIPVIAGEAHLV